MYYVERISHVCIKEWEEPLDKLKKKKKKQLPLLVLDAIKLIVLL